MHVPPPYPDLGVVVPTGVSTDPESLRFQYPLDNPPVPKKKTPPTVYREQDRFLPINNVSRVMRNAIPRTGKVKSSNLQIHNVCLSLLLLLLLLFTGI